jgi:hypothetical protein
MEFRYPLVFHRSLALHLIFKQLNPIHTLILLLSNPFTQDVTESAILSKKCTCTCVLFRTVSETELFHCGVPKLLITKRYYVPFLIPVFIVIQFT